MQTCTNARSVRRWIPRSLARGLVIHAGSLALPLGPDAVAVPFDRL
jgi:hypothetical protein